MKWTLRCRPPCFEQCLRANLEVRDHKPLANCRGDSGELLVYRLPNRAYVTCFTQVLCLSIVRTTALNFQYRVTDS